MAGNVTKDGLSDDVERQFERSVVKYPKLARAVTSMRASASRPELSTATESTASESITTESTATEPSYPAIITLNVGGRHFMVSADVLVANSGLFRHQLSDHSSWTPQPDGSYFVDADPDLFSHLIAFMRRPSVFPVLYSPVHGFDYILYNRLEPEAEHFEIDSLYQWIKEKEFEKAVKVYTHISMTRELDSNETTTLTTGGTDEIKIFKGIRKVYLCPLQINTHWGRPDRCGQDCLEALAGYPAVYDDDPIVKVVRIEHEVVFDERVCRSSI